MQASAANAPHLRFCTPFSAGVHLYQRCWDNTRRRGLHIVHGGFPYEKPPLIHSVAAPLPQKVTHRSPVCLQARSQRLPVATNFLRARGCVSKSNQQDTTPPEFLGIFAMLGVGIMAIVRQFEATVHHGIHHGISPNDDWLFFSRVDKPARCGGAAATFFR